MAVEGPALGRKMLFWLILGMSSTFFAEVTVGSQPFPFFDPFSLLIVVPLYTLHILVLGTVAVRNRKVTLGALFVSGIVFGLYEAYITKVIWDPYWEFGTTVYVAEVAVIQTAILVLWYHNFFAFIIPLAAAETVCTSSRKVFSCLPAVVRSRFGEKRLLKTLVILGVFFGVLQAASNHGPAVSLASVGASGLVLFAACYAFNRKGAGVTHTIDELLPDRRQFRVLFALLLAFYAVMTVLLLPENLPGIVGNGVILLAYVGVLLLLWKVLKKDGVESREGSPAGAVPPAPTISAKHALLWLSAYFVTATLMGFVVVLAGITALVIHICGVGLGLFILLRTVLRSTGRA